ncbi:transcriptional regulator [Bacillus cereus]|uniref:transcriptional regulator n=1 Tax=Bacillus cereus TaxID=1396 RepID=UPI000EECB076|nr:transcriptional regulator [Bacillus cereus]RHW05875.1 transcriptional regulator [Bacillus cereus]
MGNLSVNELLKSWSENNQYQKALSEFEKELMNSSDRGLVLVCGSIIDQMLSDLLKTFLIKSDKIENDLFKGNSILATFDAKIQMSYYLGLISKIEKDNINYLQRIRNKFAHQFVNISFESNDIINMCRNFEIPKNCYIPIDIPLTNEGNGELPKVELNPIKKETSAKERFIFTFRYLYHTLICKITSKEFGKREEYKKVITADNAILMQINIIEDALDKYEIAIGEMQDLLDEMKKGQVPDYNNQDAIEEYEAEVEKTEEKYKVYLQLFKSDLLPSLKSKCDVLKNSIKK